MMQQDEAGSQTSRGECLSIVISRLVVLKMFLQDGERDECMFSLDEELERDAKEKQRVANKMLERQERLRKKLEASKFSEKKNICVPVSRCSKRPKPSRGFISL